MTPERFLRAAAAALPSMQCAMFEHGRALPASLVLAGTSQGNGARVTPLHEKLVARGYP
ncbi:MAG: hypothetical protein ACJ8B6_12525 [Gemmatimonadales bacterium]